MKLCFHMEKLSILSLCTLKITIPGLVTSATNVKCLRHSAIWSWQNKWISKSVCNKKLTLVERTESIIIYLTLVEAIFSFTLIHISFQTTRANFGYWSNHLRNYLQVTTTFNDFNQTIHKELEVIYFFILCNIAIFFIHLDEYYNFIKKIV